MLITLGSNDQTTNYRILIIKVITVDGTNEVRSADNADIAVEHNRPVKPLSATENTSVREDKKRCGYDSSDSVRCT